MSVRHMSNRRRPSSLLALPTSSATTESMSVLGDRFPAVRIGEDDTENAAAAFSILVQESRAIQFAQLSRNVKSQAGPAAAGRVERFEYLIGGGCVDAVTRVK